MYKKIIKFLSLICICVCFFTYSKIANAYITYYANNAIYISDPITVTADSSQWDFRSPYWVLATPDFQQGYCNTWANVNGTWYYIDKEGHMIVNHILQDLNTNKLYYIKEDGSLLVNGYHIDYNDGQKQYHADNNGVLTLVK